MSLKLFSKSLINPWCHSLATSPNGWTDNAIEVEWLGSPSFLKQQVITNLENQFYSTLMVTAHMRPCHSSILLMQIISSFSLSSPPPLPTQPTSCSPWMLVCLAHFNKHGLTGVTQLLSLLGQRCWKRSLSGQTWMSKITCSNLLQLFQHSRRVGYGQSTEQSSQRKSMHPVFPIPQKPVTFLHWMMPLTLTTQIQILTPTAILISNHTTKCTVSQPATNPHYLYIHPLQTWWEPPHYLPTPMSQDVADNKYYHSCKNPWHWSWHQHQCPLSCSTIIQPYLHTYNSLKNRWRNLLLMQRCPI